MLYHTDKQSIFTRLPGVIRSDVIVDSPEADAEGVPASDEGAAHRLRCRGPGGLQQQDIAVMRLDVVVSEAGSR
ncbi:MAG TPA: hypothetical protein PLV07_02405, partial [Acidiphilium sp.]|nr:hypothetical protein [Acidiphilium sp.]